MNNQELKNKVNSAMYTLIKENGIASPVEVQISIGVLSKADYERWRRGELDYLERVCKINLRKLSAINSEIRAFTRKNDLKPSWTFYKKWKSGKSKGNSNMKSIKLRFSKSGNENIENFYATHYISQSKVEAAKERRNQSQPADSAAEESIITE